MLAIYQEQKFIRVSGQRQLFWRSFISIIEEISGYDTTDLYDLLDIFGLAIVCQVDPGIYRLELANHFHKNYIMPLAEFYKIAIEKKFIYDCVSAKP